MLPRLIEIKILQYFPEYLCVLYQNYPQNIVRFLRDLVLVSKCWKEQIVPKLEFKEVFIVKLGYSHIIEALLRFNVEFKVSYYVGEEDLKSKSFLNSVASKMYSLVGPYWNQKVGNTVEKLQPENIKALTLPNYYDSKKISEMKITRKSLEVVEKIDFLFSDSKMMSELFRNNKCKSIEKLYIRMGDDKSKPEDISNLFEIISKSCPNLQFFKSYFSHLSGIKLECFKCIKEVSLVWVTLKENDYKEIMTNQTLEILEIRSRDGYDKNNLINYLKDNNILKVFTFQCYRQYIDTRLIVSLLNCNNTLKELELDINYLTNREALTEGSVTNSTLELFNMGKASLTLKEYKGLSGLHEIVNFYFNLENFNIIIDNHPNLKRMDCHFVDQSLLEKYLLVHNTNLEVLTISLYKDLDHFSIVKLLSNSLKLRKLTIICEFHHLNLVYDFIHSNYPTVTTLRLKNISINMDLDQLLESLSTNTTIEEFYFQEYNNIHDTYSYSRWIRLLSKFFKKNHTIKVLHIKTLFCSSDDNILDKQVINEFKNVISNNRSLKNLYLCDFKNQSITDILESNLIDTNVSFDFSEK